MYDLKITTEQIEFANKLVSVINYGGRSVKNGVDSNGDKYQQRNGILSQIVFADDAGLERPKIDEKGWDGGFDYKIWGKKADIKSMKRSVEVRPEFTNNFVASQLNYKCDYIIFSSLLEQNNEIKKLTICGVTNKENLKQNARFYTRGTVRRMTNGVEFPLRFDMYELDMKYLEECNSYDDIERYIVKDVLRKGVNGDIKFEKINEYGSILNENFEYKLKYPYIQNLIKAYREVYEDRTTNGMEILKIMAAEKEKQEKSKEYLIEMIKNTNFNIA